MIREWLNQLAGQRRVTLHLISGNTPCGGLIYDDGNEFAELVHDSGQTTLVPLANIVAITAAV